MIEKLSNCHYRSVLCLNGELPEAHFFRQNTLPLIAADGAANKLVKMQLTPEIIIGDLDSVNSDIRLQHSVLHKPCQNSSDFQKALDYLEVHQLLPTIIVGVSGGRIDHILNNVNIFMGTKSIFYAPPLIGFTMVEGQSEQFSLPIDTKISILGIPEACINSKGLKWELNEYQLAFPGKTSCFNRSLSSQVNFSILNGTALILIYEDPET